MGHEFSFDDWNGHDHDHDYDFETDWVRDYHDGRSPPLTPRPRAVDLSDSDVAELTMLDTPALPVRTSLSLPRARLSTTPISIDPGNSIYTSRSSTTSASNLLDIIIHTPESSTILDASEIEVFDSSPVIDFAQQLATQFNTRSAELFEPVMGCGYFRAAYNTALKVDLAMLILVVLCVILAIGAFGVVATCLLTTKEIMSSSATTIHQCAGSHIARRALICVLAEN